MALTIIDRFEQKYFITDSDYKKLMRKINDKLEKDKYFKETIYNVYFDNDSNELINRSMDKPMYKEKVRLRSYEIPKNDTVVFLEIKKKFDDYGNKRRIEITHKEALDYIEKRKIPKCNKQIMNEIDYCFNKYNLKPIVSINYDRLAYYFKEDPSYRITFDNNVRYSFNDVSLKDLSDSNLLFENGYIMEVKTLNGLPLWFNKILDELRIYPTSYSKIGKIYTSIGGVYV